MDITPLIGAGQQVIQSYSGGRFKISGRHYDSAVIVLASEVITWKLPDGADFKSLTVEDFQPLIAIASELDVVLWGCGDTIDILPLATKRALKAAGLNVDVMDTGAACRTYNVLMAEGRRIAAALMPVSNI
jgi:uncharacterized protein